MWCSEAGWCSTALSSNDMTLFIPFSCRRLELELTSIRSIDGRVGQLGRCFSAGYAYQCTVLTVESALVVGHQCLTDSASPQDCIQPSPRPRTGSVTGPLTATRKTNTELLHIQSVPVRTASSLSSQRRPRSIQTTRCDRHMSAGAPP